MVWTVNESLQGWAMVRTVTGVLLNVALNLVLIPRFGAPRRGIRTLISYAWSA
jgi:O-antigen/teichoic acid export membrane protein